MNKPSINHTQKQNQEGIIRVERNLTETLLWHPNESRKFFEKRSIIQRYTDEKGKGYDIDIKVLYDPELGTLTTFDQRVYFCLVELWQKQGQPAKSYFSLRQINEMLGGKSSDTTSVKNSLVRLRSVAIHWNGAFFDFSKKKYIHITNPFTVLNHLAIISTKEEVIRDKVCEFSFDEHIVNNFLNNGTRPINRLVIQSLNSPAEQLLYTLLDREMYGTNEYSILTDNLFRQLGLTAKRWRFLNNRIRALNTWRDGIIDKSTSYGEIFNYFEITTAKTTTKDKKLEVKRTGAKKIALTLDHKPKILRLAESINKTHSEARSESISTQSIEKSRREREVVREQNKAVTEGVAKKAEIEEKPKVISHEFLVLFSKLFPKAYQAEKASRKITDRADEFVKKHTLEKAKDFLYFAFELGNQDQYKRIMEGKSVNYLFDYKVGDQLLTEAWIVEKGQRVRLKKEATEREREQKHNQIIDFEKKYTSQYDGYLKQIFDTLSDEKIEEYKAYTERVIDEAIARLPNNHNRVTVRSMKWHLQKQQYRNCRFRTFCNENLGIEILTFSEWIENFGGEEGQEYKRLKQEYEELKEVE